MYIGDSWNHRIRKVTVSTGIITTIAGSGGTGSYSGDNGPATNAELYFPEGIAFDSAGTSQVTFIVFSLYNTSFSLGNLYIADHGNSRIRKVTVSTGIITTFAGNGSTGYSGDNGDATSAGLFNPFGIAVDSAGTY